MAHAVIMAGGLGERFWPLTHKAFPKYRIRLDGKKSLLRGTFDRLAKIYGKNRVHVVTTHEHKAMIREELPSLAKSSIFIEPFRNNTAAAIYLSTAILADRSGAEEPVSFFPADHLIQNEHLFGETVRGALRLAKVRPLLVTVGIKPTFPATGYGYIESGASIAGFPSARRVKRFVEKPDRKKAVAYARRKDFFWNAGIFVWRPSVFDAAMSRFSPEFRRGFDLKNLATSYKRLPNTSIDYALMEKADNIAVYRTKMDWCDMGNFDMLLEKSPKDGTSSFIHGKTLAREARGALVLNQTDRPLIALGVEGFIVVQTEQGTLLCPKGRSEEGALLLRKFAC